MKALIKFAFLMSVVYSGAMTLFVSLNMLFGSTIEFTETGTRVFAAATFYVVCVALYYAIERTWPTRK